MQSPLKIEPISEKRDSIGFIGGKFLPLHSGHLYVISLAKTYVDKLYVIVCYSKNQPFDHLLRQSWLGKELADIEGIEIFAVEDTFDKDGNYQWKEGSTTIKNKIGNHIDYIFSSEQSYDEIFKKLYPTTKHIIFDRNIIPISGTKIRENPFKYWEYIPTEVRKHFVKKIAIVGIESCGKSTMAKYLSKTFNTNYVKEVGRDYCYDYTNKLTPELFNEIAMKHFLLQNKLSEQSNKLMFVDSEAIITQYYHIVYFGYKSKFIESIIDLQQFDLYLFLEPDVEWVNDGIRFLGNNRDFENNILKEMLNERNIKYITISGNYTDRLKQAKEIISKQI